MGDRRERERDATSLYANSDQKEIQRTDEDMKTSEKVLHRSRLRINVRTALSVRLCRSVCLSIHLVCWSKESSLAIFRSPSDFDASLLVTTFVPCTWLQWRTEGGRGGESPRAALPNGRQKMFKIYIKNGQIYVKKVTFCVNTDKRAEN